MSAKGIREFDGKRLLAGSLGDYIGSTTRVVGLDLSESSGDYSSLFQKALDSNPWLASSSLVVKPDQLIKRRGKNNLIGLNMNWEQVCQWVIERAKSPLTVGSVQGSLKNFIVEPFVPHSSGEEHYLAVLTQRDGDEILFCETGGVDVGDVDSKAHRIFVPIGQKPSISDLAVIKNDAIRQFTLALYDAFVENSFTYLEINPVVFTKTDSKLYVLDLAAKIDETAEFESGNKWKAALGHELEFPAPFGRDLTPEEKYVSSLDAKTGASLKLTILNPNGRIWTMVAGGGASVAYSDAIAAAGFAHELANYGEYSGAPSENQTYEYAKTILDLMTRGEPRHEGKLIFIGGGIANFTNVATTFSGIIRALQEFQSKLVQHGVEIYVRRGGPNYQEGLRLMRDLGDSLGVPMNVFGPETHITSIVPMALAPADSRLTTPPEDISIKSGGSSNLLDQIHNQLPTKREIVRSPSPFNALENVPERVKRFAPSREESLSDSKEAYDLFFSGTQSFVYGMQPKAVQGMLDFDYVCKRKTPSVAAMIYPFGGNHVQRFYWGTQETLISVYTTVTEAIKKHPNVDTLVNFASFRSVFESVSETLDNVPQIKTIAIIAEGVPERRTRELIAKANAKQVTLIGPATVGGLKAGAFKLGNTGGMIDNIVSSKLYRSGSASYVSKSGGMSNELNNILANYADGVLEGVAIGGDRYPGTTFIDHLLRFEMNPNCKFMLLLGEVGGIEEYKVAEAIKSGKISKPVIAWCIGTCADMFGSEVQFGHAGACANSNSETSNAKNKALKEVGAIVPNTFEMLPQAIEETYRKLVNDSVIVLKPEPSLPKIPIDYSWAQELGLIRKPASFLSSICDDRGQELLYAGMSISSVFKENIGIGGVLSLLWFKRRLPEYACKFIEMVLMLCADHGPAVSGAHNTIVAARAGKDLISSLASGLLTIGDRFGGATDGAAEQFSSAYDQGMSPSDFVAHMRKQHKLIMGIGHKIKSKTNPDMRVVILQDFARRHFPSCSLLDYSLKVEEITTAKKENLILNVDGTIGVLFVDLLRGCGAFTREEADEYIKIGTLNGLFVLGRSIGFIGHFIDQRQLKQGLYRHPWDDISYLKPDAVDLAKYLNQNSNNQAE